MGANNSTEARTRRKEVADENLRFRRARALALKNLGRSTMEIAKIMGLKESSVRFLMKDEVV